MNGQRIVRHLEALSEYGKNPQGGVSPVAYTEADRAGRQYVIELMRDAGPKEFSRPSDIENGANVLLDTVLGLDRGPDAN